MLLSDFDLWVRNTSGTKQTRKVTGKKSENIRLIIL